jgi:hypothetical protein
MRNDELEQRIRDAMTNDETLPHSDLWAGIGTRRQAGDRVTLPLDRVQRRLLPVLAWSGLAAAILLALMPLVERPGVEQPTHSVPTGPAPRGEPNFLFPGSLMAQVSATPRYSARVGSGADRRPGKWTHGRFEHGELRETYSYELTRSTYQDQPAWLILSSMSRLGRSWSVSDSTFASIDSMQPLLRIGHTGGARIEQTYRKDDILTGVTRNGYTSWSTVPQRDPSLPFGGGSLFRPSEMSVRLMAADLGEGWKGSIPLPSSSEQGIAPLWLNLVVDGSETLTVPAGTFETWRLRTVFRNWPLKPYDSEHPPEGIYFWVSKDKRWLVQMSLVSRAGERDDTPLVLLTGEEQ